MTAVVDVPAQQQPPAKVTVARPIPPTWFGPTLWVTTVVGVLAAWIVGYSVGLSALQEQHSQHVLYAKFRQQLALQTAPPHVLPSGQVAAIKPGEPTALLTVPRIGLHRAVVVQGTRSEDLRTGPGHLPGTVLPGENGSSWIIGRSTTYGAPFAGLSSMRAGDDITVTTQQGVFTYVVNDVRGAGDRIPSTESAARLTLASSVGSGWRSRFAPTTAVYVDATLTTTPLAVSAAPQAVSAADGLMHGDPAALVPLFLWLLALVGGALILVWARARWGPWQSWMAGVPVIIAALWGATDSFLQLLPNAM